MQYVLKITALNVPHHLFRLVSIDGMADVDHVLNLCNLAFNYPNSAHKRLYFAQDKQAFNKLNLKQNGQSNIDNHYGPIDIDYEFYKHSLILNNNEFNVVKVAQENLMRFDELIATNYAKIALEKELKLDNLESAEFILAQRAGCGTHPNSTDEEQRFKFVYQLNDIQHLVEVMCADTKLYCFLPATLMGDGDLRYLDDEKFYTENLLLDKLIVCLQYATEQELKSENLQEVGLNLKECTARMRALGAMRNNENINQAMLKAGATPLKFTN